MASYSAEHAYENTFGEKDVRSECTSQLEATRLGQIWRLSYVAKTRDWDQHRSIIKVCTGLHCLHCALGTNALSM